MLLFTRLLRVRLALCCSLLLAAGCDGAITSAKSEAATVGDGADSAANNWPVFRGNPQSTGVANSSLPPSGKLELLWKYEIENGAFEATPVIVDGVVWLGDLDGTLYAIGLQSGESRWKFVNPADKVGYNSAAAVRDGRVYLGDIEGNFYCLDATHGKKLWAFKAELEINSAPNFYRGKVLFGSQDAKLYCLDATSGEPVWQHAIGDQIRCSPTVIEDRCFLAGCDGKLHVINLNDGKEVGAVAIGAPTGSTPAAAGDFIYFGTEGAAFFCVNWRKPAEVWQWRDEARNLPIRSSAALTDRAVIFGSQDKNVHALSLQNGQRLWNFPTKGRVDGSPVVVGDRVFIGSVDGRIYGLDLNNGKKVWEYEAGGKLMASPAVANGRLVIASDRGVVYCFGAKKEERVNR
ncbi:MAG: PQQ-binding-like beta-propeller repeat protein [Pirellulales bacterium]|nr:PQQ-binding-like beta-propeller repeat protein [Pirellulales bacterium]